MGRLLAQELELVRREIDHQQFAAGGEQARGFGDRGGRFVEEMQHLMHDHGVGRAVGSGTFRYRPAGPAHGEPGALELLRA